MNFTIYDASVPVFVSSLTNMQAWLDKAAKEMNEAELLEARLAPDMRPLPAQFQLASDTAKGAVARLAGVDNPSMADTEVSFEELKGRCRRTIDFIQSVGREAFEASADREVILKFAGNKAYRFAGRDYLTTFALPNFFFHVTAAYAILRSRGVALGKPDFLRHLGPPNHQL